jgi:hypothetical protein
MTTSGLDKLIKEGRAPPYFKAGRMLRWRPSIVRAWTIQQEERAATEAPKVPNVVHSGGVHSRRAFARFAFEHRLPAEFVSGDPPHNSLNGVVNISPLAVRAFRQSASQATTVSEHANVSNRCSCDSACCHMAASYRRFLVMA